MSSEHFTVHHHGKSGAGAQDRDLEADHGGRLLFGLFLWLTQLVFYITLKEWTEPSHTHH